jgi:hypothetical protein
MPTDTELSPEDLSDLVLGYVLADTEKANAALRRMVGSPLDAAYLLCTLAELASAQYPPNPAGEFATVEVTADDGGEVPDDAVAAANLVQACVNRDTEEITRLSDQSADDIVFFVNVVGRLLPQVTRALQQQGPLPSYSLTDQLALLRAARL